MPFLAAGRSLGFLGILPQGCLRKEGQSNEGWAVCGGLGLRAGYQKSGLLGLPTPVLQVPPGPSAWEADVRAAARAGGSSLA